ncbi:homogentisate phytyltransferase [Chrysosporum bergii ANA360D]|jgi:homogentisate phytyltransferase/homogentisate geranylgeranyltransferase|uniref:Homogentisate phytyltransferase n=1 Tax=Chrysosporum bergii ANA360D TaxID=617107 RepID=A0AA43GVD5_9CYAN|nr:homogentisate phytyltransferase [Chrysosporum bergii]MDH6061895.1 homogentisate phytyltransferase [Chrysosporum bergii ANA360D]
MNQISPPSSHFSQTWLYAFWKFSRPHTVIGTSLSVWGLYLIAIPITGTSFTIEQLISVFFAWLACLCGNVYIVGLNQLEDVEIDKINKPHLPLASGEFSQHQGKLIVITMGILSLVLAWLTGPFLLGMVALSLAIGTAYSLPPIRLKQFPFWAAMCIFSVRGTIVNLGLFLHFNWALGKTPTIPAAIWVLTVFILIFTFAIAIFKDIPDMEGDRLYNITTFTLQLGPQAVFNLALWVLTLCYLGMILVGVLRLSALNPAFLAMTHLVVLVGMWMRSLAVDLQDKTAISQFYQFIWKLFYLEYIIFPIACILA